MTDIIVAAVLLIIIGAAVAYIVKAKKSGVKCIGCPHGASCAACKGNDGECSCGDTSAQNCKEK